MLRSGIHMTRNEQRVGVQLFQNNTRKDYMTKEQAIKFVLRTITNRMAIMTPDKNKALTLSVEHGITVEDLINTMENIVRNT
jgi:hypothetical protein